MNKVSKLRIVWAITFWISAVIIGFLVDISNPFPFNLIIGLFFLVILCIIYVKGDSKLHNTSLSLIGEEKK